MTKSRRIVLATLCLLCVLGIFLAQNECHAQDFSQDTMEKQGIGGLVKGKKFWDDERAPEKWQVVLGLVAPFVAFAVFKWL